MRIGLSFSRCLLDIVEGQVDIKDVLVVVARTNFDPNNDDQWDGIWNGYTSFGGLSNPEWARWSFEEGAEEKFRAVALQLWNDGKLHQPRKFGAYPSRLPYYWLEASLPTEELESNPAVKKAWEQFQIVAGLSKSTKILKDDF